MTFKPSMDYAQARDDQYEFKWKEMSLGIGREWRTSAYTLPPQGSCTYGTAHMYESCNDIGFLIR
jgi:hypothetical protein